MALRPEDDFNFESFGSGEKDARNDPDTFDSDDEGGNGPSVAVVPIAILQTGEPSRAVFTSACIF